MITAPPLLIVILEGGRAKRQCLRNVSAPIGAILLLQQHFLLPLSESLQDVNL